MTEVLFRLMFATKGVQPPYPDHKCQPEGMDPDVRFVAIGHSFGARVLEHAMGQPLFAMFLEQKYEAEACAKAWNEQHQAQVPIKPQPLPSPADLIVFLNPANDAFETKSMIEAFKRSGITRSKDQPPLLISVTSKGDWVTGMAMPIAQKLGTQGIGFRKYDDDRCSKGQLHLRHQTNFWRSNDGNIHEMNSHKVELVGMSQCSSQADWHYFKAPVKGQLKCFQIEPLHTKKAPPNETKTDDEKVKCYQEQERTGRPWNDTPFWVIDVTSALIPKHSDIFQGGTLELLRAIVKRSKPALPETLSETSPVIPCSELSAKPLW